MKQLPYLALLAALALGSLPASAQIQLKGRVIDRANLEPVPNALVAIAGSAQSTRTDAKGEFALAGGSALNPDAARASANRPMLRDRFLILPAAWAGRSFLLEVFSSKGKRLKSRQVRSMEAPGRLDLSAEHSALSYRFLRVTFAGDTFRFRLPAAQGNGSEAVEMSASVPSAPGPGLAKSSATVRLDISADLLKSRSLDVRSDSGDLGDIVLDYPPRRLDTGSAPIYGAVRLFDGKGDSAAVKAQMDSNWIMWVGPSRKARNLGATPVVWKILRDPEAPGDRTRWTFSECCGVPAGGPEWGYDDLVTKRKFNDYQLHVEFNLMGSPGDEDPAGNCNSGVYQENRYELQIETIPNPWDPKNSHGMGSIINEFAPPSNLSRPPGRWQAYDITFRNDRYTGTQRTQQARTTIFWNGVLIHNNRKIAGSIACCDGGNVPMDSTIQGLKLQNEKGSDVRFRNIWMKPLNIKDTLTNFGY